MNTRTLHRRAYLAIPLIFAILSVSSFSTESLAQRTSLPEHQRLAFFVGDWTNVIGPSSGTVTWEWFGDFFVRGNELFTNSGGRPVRTLAVIGYDADEEVYTFNPHYETGYRDTAKGWVHDKT